MTAVDLLRHRNADFVAHRFPGPMALSPTLRATVIGCLDPRVDPAVVLGLELGDAPVIRNIGGRITPAVLEILDLLAMGFRDQMNAEADKGDLIVLQHTQCGIVRMQSSPVQLAASFGVDIADLPSKAVPDPRAALVVDVALLNGHEGITDSYRVTGLLYDVSTGLVEQVVPAPSSTDPAAVS